MRARLRRFVPASIGLLLFGFALDVLRAELHAVSWHHLTRPSSRSTGRLALALVLTCDQLRGPDRLRLPRVRLHRQAAAAPQLAAASFLAYAISNNVGFAMLSGASVRYRFYTRWGVTAEELSRIVFSYSVTFWLGLLALGGRQPRAEPAAERGRGLPARRAGRPSRAGC